jgi:hypothetical protein
LFKLGLCLPPDVRIRIECCLNTAPQRGSVHIVWLLPKQVRLLRLCKASEARGSPEKRQTCDV